MNYEKEAEVVAQVRREGRGLKLRFATLSALYLHEQKSLQACHKPNSPEMIGKWIYFKKMFHVWP